VTALPSALALLEAQIERRLMRLLQRIDGGGDCPPAERARLEGWMEAALLLSEGASAQLVSHWKSLLPASGAGLQCDPIAEGWRVRLDLWQQRAPVVPSTRP
jgi:hypothetical protein